MWARGLKSLPTVLNDSEAQALLDAATTLRERLVLSLLYGCGLTVGELRRLRWENLDPEAKALHAPGDHRLQPRILPLPECLVPIVQAAHQHGSQEALVLPGGRPSKPLSARWIQCLVRAAAQRADILKPVSQASRTETRNPRREPTARQRMPEVSQNMAGGKASAASDTTGTP